MPTESTAILIAIKTRNAFIASAEKVIDVSAVFCRCETRQVQAAHTKNPRHNVHAFPGCGKPIELRFVDSDRALERRWA